MRRLRPIALARDLRAASGASVEAFPGEGTLGKQLKYAAQKGARVAIIVGPDEAARGLVTVKDLVAATQMQVADIDWPGVNLGSFSLADLGADVLKVENPNGGFGAAHPFGHGFASRDAGERFIFKDRIGVIGQIANEREGVRNQGFEVII